MVTDNVKGKYIFYIVSPHVLSQKERKEKILHLLLHYNTYAHTQHNTFLLDITKGFLFVFLYSSKF